MLLNPFPQLAINFTVNKEHKLYFAEASDLGIPPWQAPGGQLYDDAADNGLTLYNTRGDSIHWVESEPVMEDDWVAAWVFKPTTEALRAIPKLEGWELHILND